MRRAKTTLHALVLLLAFAPACANERDGGTIGTRGPVPADRAKSERPAFAGEEAQSAPASDEALAGRASEKRDRGLGTAFGEHHHSDVETTSFARAEPHAPDAVLALRYDDRDGLSARHGSREQFGSRVQEDGLSLALLDESGHTMPALFSGGTTWVAGDAGERYMIGIENETDSRFEAVVSVDGLDVVDGALASFDKRGYVVEPFTSTVIDGWRTSQHSVAAFRFADLEESYAARSGQSRNVGVVGVAFFREQPVQRTFHDHDHLDHVDHVDHHPDHCGLSDVRVHDLATGRRDRRESRRRETANPFPG